MRKIIWVTILVLIGLSVKCQTSQYFPKDTVSFFPSTYTGTRFSVKGIAHLDSANVYGDSIWHPRSNGTFTFYQGNALNWYNGKWYTSTTAAGDSIFIPIVDSTNIVWKRVVFADQNNKLNGVPAFLYQDTAFKVSIGGSGLQPARGQDARLFVDGKVRITGTLTLPNLASGAATDSFVTVGASGNIKMRSVTVGSGSVTSFSAGNLSPLFTTNVATATTTPALTFTLSNAAAHTFLGNSTGSGAPPTYVKVDLSADVSNVLPIANGGTNNGSLSVTNQNIIIADGSKLIGLAKGTNGQHLITNGSGNLAWVDTLSNNANWKILGNASTDSSTNFIGTTDSHPLVFRTNNTQRGFFNSGTGDLVLNNGLQDLNDGGVSGTPISYFGSGGNAVGWYWRAGGLANGWKYNGVVIAEFAPLGVAIGSSSGIVWSTGSPVTNSADIGIMRQGVNILAITANPTPGVNDTLGNTVMNRLALGAAGVGNGVMFNVTSGAQASFIGLANTTSGSATVTGTGTAFLNTLRVGDTVFINTLGKVAVLSIADNTHFTATATIGSTLPGVSYYNATLYGSSLFSINQNASVQYTYPPTGTAGTDSVMVWNATSKTIKKISPTYYGTGTGGGTVTTVGFTGGLISVANPTTTPAFTVAGTSGGVVYFSSTSTWASSGLLAANALMIGGGAGTAPSTTTTGTGVLTALGINTSSAGGMVLFNGAGGTPSSLTLTNATGLPIGGITGLGTGVGTALAVNVGSAGAFVTFNGAGGTPSSLTLTNATGLPVGGLSYAANTLAANNTGSTAAPTAFTFKEVTETTYTGTATWDGTPPSGATTHTYHWSQIGHTVTLWINLLYATGGTTNTTVTMDFPSGVPLPATVTGFTGNNVAVTMGSGSMGANIQGTTGSIVRGYVATDGSGNPILVVLASASLSAKVARITVVYQSQ